MALAGMTFNSNGENSGEQVQPPSRRIVVAITGGSGAIYGVRLLEVLLARGLEVHLTISPAATQVLHQELGVQLNLKQFDPRIFDAFAFGNTGQSGPNKENEGRLFYHHFQDFQAGIASGSFLTAGMAICPCSMGTLASLANGISTNLIHRAADVHLKERRKLIVVPRETPLGVIQLQNMKTLAEAGGVILPAMPGFYHRPQTIQELVDFVVTRICDQLGISLKLTKRWGEDA